MLISASPHHTNIGKREFMQMLTATRRPSGQPWGGPSGLRDQSVARKRSPMSVAGRLIPSKDDGEDGRPVIAGAYTGGRRRGARSAQSQAEARAGRRAGRGAGARG